MFSDQASFFDTDVVNNKVTLILKNKLSEEVLKSNVFLTLDLLATKPDFITGVTVLNIELPQTGSCAVNYYLTLSVY